MVAVGDKAPDVEGATADGGRLKLSSLHGKSVVLYFYPEADTPGCTNESKGLRDMYPTLRSKQVEVVGVSTDDVAKQCAFAEKYALPFPLWADHSRTIAQTYGVLDPRGKARRVTFLLDPDGKVAEIVDDRKAETHISRVRSRYLSG